jgi:hypothetical protein
LKSETVHYAGADVTAPELLQSDLAVSHPRHCKTVDGIVIFSAVVDAAGIPRQLKTIQANGGELAIFASELVVEEKFKPGAFQGVAAPVAIELTIGLKTCAQGKKDASGIR